MIDCFKNNLLDSMCHTIKAFRESEDLPESERYTSVNYRCTGVSAVLLRKGRQNRYRCCAEEKNVYGNVTKSARASL